MNALTAGITPPRLTFQVQTQEQNHATANVYAQLDDQDDCVQFTPTAHYKVTGISSFPWHTRTSVGRRQQTPWSQQHWIPAFSCAVPNTSQRLAVLPVPRLHLQPVVDSPLAAASWLSTAGTTQGLHLRFILTCDTFLTSFTSRKEKWYCL